MEFILLTLNIVVSIEVFLTIVAII